MDFSQRGTQSAATHTPSTAAPAPHGKKRIKGMAWQRVIMFVLLLGITVVILAAAGLAVYGGTTQESKYLKEGNLQAVFLNNGQVYFGGITNLNSRYVRLSNVYYLRQSDSPQPDKNSGTSNANSNLSLVKLGCEIHGPEDEMIINRDQISFWENLKTDGQVAKAVQTFVQQNPDGQKCQTS